VEDEFSQSARLTAEVDELKDFFGLGAKTSLFRSKKPSPSGTVQTRSEIDIGNYFYGFPIRSGMTMKRKQLQAKLELFSFHCHCRTLTRQSRDFVQSQDFDLR